MVFPIHLPVSFGVSSCLFMVSREDYYFNMKYLFSFNNAGIENRLYFDLEHICFNFRVKPITCGTDEKALLGFLDFSLHGSNLNKKAIK